MTPAPKHSMIAPKGSSPGPRRAGGPLQSRTYTPPSSGHRRLIVLGVVAVCFIVMGAYFLQRRPSTKSGLPMAASSVTATSAIINWTTAQPSSAQVEYGTTPAYGFLSAFISQPSMSHSVALTGLTPGKTYNYAALSTDRNGKITTSANSTFTTTGAGESAAIGNVTASAITATSVTITWTTSLPLASQVEYGTSATKGSLSAFNSVPSTFHTVVLTGLTAGTAYNYATLSTDSSGQISKSPDAVFTTTGEAGAAVISRVTTVGITTTSATITWITDQPSSSQVEYGKTPAYGALSAFISSHVTSHSLNLTGLTPGTGYNYAALSTNSTGGVGRSGNLTFTTASVAGSPAVSGVAVSHVTSNSATINWITDQPSSSQVEYGATTAYGSLSAFSSSLVTSHSINLTGLTPGMSYSYAALSTNSTGRVGASGNLIFTAGAGPPVVTQVRENRITSTSVTITWTTDQPSSSQLEYGATTTLSALLHRHRHPYGSKSVRDSSLVTFHSATATGLTPDTTYNYTVLSANSAGMENSSPNRKFSTPAVRTRIEIRGRNARIALEAADLDLVNATRLLERLPR